MSEYLVIYERAEDGGWGAYLPDLPGVVALVATRDEVTARVAEAVDAYVEELASIGLPLPEPVAAAGTIQAPWRAPEEHAPSVCRAARRNTGERGYVRGTSCLDDADLSETRRLPDLP